MWSSWLIILYNCFSGESSTTFTGLCKVVWTVEADLAAGQLLYITGDPVVMGCWEPEMAILMSPVQQANIWKAEVVVIVPSCDSNTCLCLNSPKKFLLNLTNFVPKVYLFIYSLHVFGNKRVS